jgi:hypothetical protein
MRPLILLRVVLSLTGLSILGIPSGLAQSLDQPLYMGKASTGEQVWFYGGRSQCGDLPKDDQCWRNPMIVYRLDDEAFNTVVDCRLRLFKDARSQSTGKAYLGIRPSSDATRAMIQIACANASLGY